jgi:hypothetical protein
LDAFAESYGPKYDKAVDCLTKELTPNFGDERGQAAAI